MPDARFRLAVWLGGRHLADLDDVGGDRLRLTYTPDAVREGALFVSAALPVRSAHYPPGAVAPYLEGLLPEGEMRTRIEQRFGVRRGHVFGLLRAIGRDCAGAVALLPPGETPTDSLAEAEPLDDERLAAEVASLGTAPLGVDAHVRLSLAGLQDKLLVARLPDGRWARPVDGAPSTHILKPEPARFPGLARLEAFGLAVARELGMTVADADVVEVAGRPVLAVSRFDRRVGEDGRVLRIHQEDFCQALGRSPVAKYQADGGPGFVDAAFALRAVSSEPPVDLVRLLHAAVLTVLIGNADAHARNFSMAYRSPRDRRLAPLYDLVPTTLLTVRPGEAPLSSSLAMSVNGVWEVDAVTGADLLAEARTWRMPAPVASGEIERMLHGAGQAVDRAAAAVGDVPADVVRRTRDRAKELLGSL
ncbi:HipA domain-containing protein [Cryptosporangium minutisporangium]|uniref:Type II toxin-antitoxin system HipA family toxin n=1 Tax=Cryptosporangium minutisporangium TaxID=113569 RepID=A0ABP6SWL5_9ACTN